MSMIVDSSRFSAGAGGAGHRYWRVQNTATQTFFALHYLEMRDGAGVNIAPGNAYNASTSYDTDHLPVTAFDGNDLKFWSTTNGGGTNGWISVDFGVPVDIEEVMMCATALGQYPTAFRVQWSDDAATWTTAWTGTLTDDITKVFVSNVGGTTAYTPPRYRVIASVLPAGGYMSYAEVVFTDIEGRDMIPIGSVASGSFSGSFDKAKAFDGNLGTRWISADNTSLNWIGFIYGSDRARDVASVTLSSSDVVGEGSRSPVSFNIDRSTDGGSTWTTLWSKVGVAAWSASGQETRTFTP